MQGIPPHDNNNNNNNNDEEEFIIGSYDSNTTQEFNDSSDHFEDEIYLQNKKEMLRRRRRIRTSPSETITDKLPAVALVVLLNLMLSIPFGVSYFPIGWKADDSGGGDGIDGGGGDGIDGVFPLPGKEALGMRMFLFSSLVGQIAFAFRSKFENSISLQMVENIPFCHALAQIVITEQGYGIESLSTLFFLFGLSSVVVGMVFYMLGRLGMGRVVYFFPSHVLVGCIGGIGAFILATGIEVSTNTSFTFTPHGIQDCLHRFDLLSIVLLFEIILRMLQHVTTKNDGTPKYQLLSPIYFCLITPMFYVCLWVFGLDMKHVVDAGFFFPSPDPIKGDDGSGNNALFNVDVLDIWRVLNLETICWVAVRKSIPTLVSLAAFSLIHVPINLPAFAISTNVDISMNDELIAHGYSNALSGLFGGLQNYMTYSNSVLYAKSGGKGRSASLLIALMTAILFVIGPEVASYIPRCMAGTLLVHIGVDLLLEGVYASYDNFDYVEYGGIWLITIVMIYYGMTAALIAGVIAALSTYVYQSVTYQNPIRGMMSGTTVRSSSWNRPAEADAILVKGRDKIFIVQLQGHIFFGNVAKLSDDIKSILEEKQGTDEEPYIVIMDFTLVNGMDSSAAQAIAKLKKTMMKKFKISVAIFVTGSPEGFPCQYDLSSKLLVNDNTTEVLPPSEQTALLHSPGRSMNLRDSRRTSVFGSANSFQVAILSQKIQPNCVCQSLDDALRFAENVLIARQNPDLLSENATSVPPPKSPGGTIDLRLERDHAVRLLANLCAPHHRPQQQQHQHQHQHQHHQQFDDLPIQNLFSHFQREVYTRGDIIWKQNTPSNSAKLVVSGNLTSILEFETGTMEPIPTGAMIGELGLVNGNDRLSTVKCVSEEAVLYSLERDKWNMLVKEQPHLARLVDGIVIHYLAHRVQHVSNRIFETRCLPV